MHLLQIARIVSGKFQIESGKSPVDFFPALYPVEYDRIIIGDPASYAVMSDTNAIIMLVTAHPVDIKIGKEMF